MTKPYRFDFHPDEYIAGVAAQLTAEEQGVYWMVCSLIMSHGGPIENDVSRLARLCLISKKRTEKILFSLAAKNKIERNPSEIRQKRAEKSVENARKIIRNAMDNGRLGGRPLSKTN